MNMLKRILESGEHSLILQTRSIVKTALRANAILEDVIDGKAQLKDVKNLRIEAERESTKISRLITTGAIAPNLIDDLILLVNVEENITEHIFNLCRQLLRYKIKDVKIRNHVLTSLRATNALSRKAITLLEQMHTLDQISQISSSRSRIKILEKDGDELKDDLLDFAFSSTTDFKTFYAVNEIAHVADDILDACEDSSDIFMSIMLSITT